MKRPRSPVHTEVSTRQGQSFRVVSIRRIFIWEESGRICSVEGVVSGGTREDTEKRYAAFIPSWEETFGALAIHPPRS